ncbi:fumarate hydratase [Sulfoacidibacillus thermotolerans]|uniref:Fumarate hydratase class I n=1 Tax=Sulfoacidibacillus thermotolerans TaxID=1765684 RepID=A0A2U3DA11_SULT2|nr:fumarate hydratase [Sulfoacidibacillus thermotolerans]PWI58119.1 fumarate hydratase [Sulfoacidibacillus thermotolerans]
MDHFQQSILELIIDTSTNLPPDVRRALARAQLREEVGSRAALALDTIVNNVAMAETDQGPICQDTGMPTFEVFTPVGANQIIMEKQIQSAVAEATKMGKLRTNSVDSLTGKNTGDNLGPGTPVIHFHQWERDDIEVKLILKGGGCENKNIQYSLPMEIEGLGKAGRDLDGVRKCILHAVYQAQGQGCSAGVVGVSIGGDRTSGYQHAKEQLFRSLEDENPIPELRDLEEYIMEKANQLGIGTMGFGGRVTLLGCKIGVQNRLPASFFVSVAYNCWAFRRQGVVINAHTGKITKWLYKEGDVQFSDRGGISTDHAIVLQAPISEEQIRKLKVGDVVLIDGAMHTGRDALHKYLMDHDAPVDLNGAVLYHCGPVMLQDEEGWHVKAAGPTTSSREEPYQADIIKKFGIRAIIGKGGMGPKTLQGLKEHGAVYLNAIGGAAQYYARTVTHVDGVDFLEQFGIPEAMWHLQVKAFPAIVTMDAHGNSLHAEIDRDSKKRLEEFAAPVYS